MASILYNDYLAIAIAWSLSISGIMINTFVLAKVSGSIIRLRKKVKTEPHIHSRDNSSKVFKILFINLAIADTLGSLYLLIIAIADLYYRFVNVKITANNSELKVNSTMIYASWIRNPFCYLARFLFLLSFASSIFITLNIAIDRYISVFYPFSDITSSTKVAIITISLAWTFSSAFAIYGNYIAYVTLLPPNVPLTYQYNNICIVSYNKNWGAKFFLFIASIIVGGIYSFVMCIYMVIFNKLRSIQTNIIFIADSTNNGYPSRKKKTLFMVLFMAITNFVVVLPNFGFGITSFVSDDLIKASDDRLIAYLVNLNLFFQCNCCINPIIFLSSVGRKYARCIKCCHKQ